MTPLLLITHAAFGAELLKAAVVMLGPQPGTMALSLELQDDRKAFAQRVEQARQDLGPPLLMLVDLPGGTPWNVAVSLAAAGLGDEVVSGLSLPLLLEALQGREGLGPQALGERLVSGSSQGVWRAGAMIGKKDGGQA